MSEEDMSPALPASVDIRRQDAKLTKRETQVLQLISYGLNSDQIADTLHLEPSTVDYHAKKIRHVLAAKSRAHAVGIAIRSGLIT
jgi:LuxR family transcriptional regulator